MRSILPLRAKLGGPAREVLRSTLVAISLEAIAAAAQGVLAVSLGTLARFLAGAPRPASSAAGMTWMSWLGGGLPPRLASVSVVTVALVGLAAIIVRGSAWLVLEARETRDAALLAARARQQILSSALQLDPAVTLGSALTWPGELEIGARAERARVRGFAHLAVLAGCVLMLDATLALLLLLLLLPFAALVRPIRRGLRKAHEAAAQGAIETVDASRDVIEHAALWASFGGGRVAMGRVDALGREGATLASQAAARRSLSSSANEILAALAIVLLVALFAPGAAFPRAALVPVLIVLVSTYRPIRDLAEAAAALDRGRRALEQLADVGHGGMDGARRRVFTPATLAVRELALDIGSERVREGVDFDLAPGSVLALIGPPGVGKSALLEALLGIRGSRGSVRLGDEQLEGAGVSERPFAWAPPSPPVLPGTLAENLAPDRPTDVARIERAREVLHALGDRTVVALDDDARVGSRGRALSSGEAQRLSLARALASDAPVLLLDEPTANLDAEGERRAIEAIRRFGAGRAIVLTSHRPAPLALADRVLDLGERVVGAAESERRIA